MKLSRRKFLFLGATTVSVGLISFPGWHYLKNNRIFASDIEIFLSNYENVTTIKSSTNISKNISRFESKILSMLSSNGMDKTINIINQDIKSEYQQGKLKLINGWIISETESKILILKKKYV